MPGGADVASANRSRDFIIGAVYAVFAKRCEDCVPVRHLLSGQV